MKSTKVAARYAKALLELAIENNKVEQIQGDMNYLLSANAETRDFQTLLKSPIIKADNKIAIFNELFDQFESVTKSFVELITNNGREGLLVEIANSYTAQVKEFNGIVPVTIVTATPLNAQTKENILTKVRGYVGGTLEVTEEIDASLIGGFVVKMDGKQIDASVSNQLNNLKQRLTR
jgi:F-type H+-transporting ATPase subunit delta